MLGVTEGDTPGGRDAVGEADRVLLPLSVEEGVRAGVPVPLAVGLCVPDGVGVAGGVALLDRLVEPVLEALAPLESDAVALVEVVLLALTVLVGVLLLVLVPDVVAVALGVCDAVCEAVTLAVSDTLPEFDALAPLLNDGVGEAEVVELQLSVELDVMLPVPEEVLVGVPVGV